MRNTRIIFGALAGVCLASVPALAQNAVTVPINNWSYQRHASTATEGALRGSAAVIQAQGQKNYMDSVAMVNFQEARRKAIENNKLYVQAYYENKATILEHRKKYSKLPPTKERWARVVDKSMPDALTEEQFNPATGELVWPHILRWDEYDAVRERLNVLVKQRTPANSGDGSPVQREIAVLIDQLESLLRSNSARASIVQYGNAVRFLRSLDFEMQSTIPAPGPAPVPATKVAVN